MVTELRTEMKEIIKEAQEEWQQEMKAMLDEIKETKNGSRREERGTRTTTIKHHHRGTQR